MFMIINKQILAKNVKRLDLSARFISQKVKPGQFVMIVPRKGSAVLPFTVVESDDKKGTITIIVKEECSLTRQLGSMSINTAIYSILGPLGNPATIEKTGLVLCVSVGSSTAQILPICRAMKKAGNRVVGVIGAEDRQSVLLEAQMRICCHKLFITTKDGSFERRGSVSGLVKELIDKENIRLVYAAGDVSDLEEICNITFQKLIKTRIQVSPIMSCGTGICGSCRVKIGKKVYLSCQDGPEFDAKYIDFKYLNARMRAYREFRNKTMQADEALDTGSNFFKKLFIE